MRGFDSPVYDCGIEMFDNKQWKTLMPSTTLRSRSQEPFPDLCQYPVSTKATTVVDLQVRSLGLLSQTLTVKSTLDDDLHGLDWTQQ